MLLKHFFDFFHGFIELIYEKPVKTSIKELMIYLPAPLLAGIHNFKQTNE